MTTWKMWAAWGLLLNAGLSHATDPSPSPAADAHEQVPADEKRKEELENFVRNYRSSAGCEGHRAATLDGAKWHAFEVLDAEIYNQNAKTNPDRGDFSWTTPKKICKSGQKAFTPCKETVLSNLRVSGTFQSYSRGASGGVVGTVMRAKRNEVDYVIRPDSKVYKRGGIAVLENGQIVICQPWKSGRPLDKRALTELCGRDAKSQVVQFMGGAATLISNGRKACDNGTPKGCDKTVDISQTQKFQGLTEGELRREDHLVFATQGKRAFVIWAERNVSGRDIQDALCEAGFDNAIKFDGSSGFGAAGSVGGRDYFTGSLNNPTGFFLRVKE